MKRILLPLFTIAVLLTAFTAPGWAAVGGHDVNARPTSDWFSTNRTLKNVPLHWMRAADPLIGAGANAATGTGTNRYVDSGVTLQNGDGLSFEQAYTTTDAAINASTAGAGDWIHVAELHAEGGTAPNLWDADIAGITIYHHGSGASQGSYTYNDTDVTCAIGAANVRVIGGRYIPSVTGVVAGIIVEAAATYFTLDGLESVEGVAAGTDEFLTFIQLTTASNDGRIVRCIANSVGEGATHWLDGGAGVIERLSVVGNYVRGDYSVSVMFSDQVDLGNYFVGNFFVNNTTAQHCIENTAASTGFAAFNSFFTDAEGTTFDPGAMYCVENYVTTAVDASAVIVPAYDDTAQNFLGGDVANSAAATTNVTANRDGTVLERLEQIEFGRVQTTSATTDFTASTDIMYAVLGGQIEIVSLFGLCTTLAGGSPGTMVIEMDATTSAQDGDFSTTVNVDALAAGDVIRFSNAIDEGVLDITTSVLAGQTLSWFAAVGDIEQTLSSTGTGVVVWSMSWRPLTAGVTVTGTSP